jgi:hypothetical protein
MSTLELEVQKAGLARQILNMEDENMLNNIVLLLKDCHPVVAQQKIPEKRKLGILNGKARIVFKDDFEMTTEELLGLQ